MDQSKILIIGKNGQLGKQLVKHYPGAKAVDAVTLDIANQKSVLDFDYSNIEIVINAAAYTKVDDAESSEGRIKAWSINAAGVSNLVNACLKNDLTLVHISSDYVFDGTKDNHPEDELFSPLSVYGASKAAGDLIVRTLPKFYLIRTSWVIGDGSNFVRTMFDLAQKGVNPSVVSDQVGRLTFTSELVRAIDYLLTRSVKYGTYNVSNSGDPVSWATITRKIFSLSGFNNEVRDVSTREYFMNKQNIAPRPLNSVLNLTKLHHLGFVSRTWQEDLESYLKLTLNNK
jgi:dTDP-4-dehydrorhamnose 3,5-epimerase